MAQVIKSSSDLKKDYRKHKRRYHLWMLLGLLFWLVFAWNISQTKRFDERLFIATFIGFGIAGSLGKWEEKRAKVLLGGLEGENKSLAVLSSLPNDYIVIPNVEINVPSAGRTELDQVVIGPGGLFIVETKNYHGILKGKAEDEKLQKIKISPAGETYTDYVKNPVRQIKRQVHILKQYLGQCGLHPYINGIVYLVHPDVTWKVTDMNSDISVICARKGGEQELQKKILSGGSGRLTAAEIKKIRATLEKLRL